MAVEEGRECLVFRAKVADQTERYDDMVDLMRKVAKLDVELTVEERSLISLAYKNIIGPRRASWRIINSIQQKEEGKGNEENAHKSRVYKCKIQDELSQICDDVIKLIDQHLIPSSTSTEALVFFYKMKGDCFRYLAEFKFNGERKEVTDQALEAYQMASTKATAELPPSHPTRLGLVLNFSVFHYEILNSPERACHMAQEAFGEAIAEIDALPEHAYKDCTLILQLIKDNLTLWTSDMPK